jgi:hypothetical protein
MGPTAQKDEISRMTKPSGALPEISPPSAAAAPPTRASTLRRKWLDCAFRNAGIDASHWDPTRGVDLNRRTIECVYDYYGRLYVNHAQLEWAGMANLIGPSFYAGFLDIGFLPDRTRRILEEVRHLVRAGRHRVGRLLRHDARVDELLVGDLGFFETTFLTMQRKIFEDQALMHEAYLRGGLNAIRELGLAGIIDSATGRAWEQIDRGDPALVRAGNRALLYREQHDIIQRFYVDMREHSPPSGRIFTYLLTLAGTPAVPGTKTYCDVFPLTLIAPISRRTRVALRTPLAAGNLALFTNRWELIEKDTLPVYQRLIAEQAAEVRALIERPIAQRVGRFRLLRRGGRIILALLTHWRLRFEAAAPGALHAAGEEVTIDLTTPPTRADAGLADDSDSRVWANLQWHPFRVSLALPGGRTFSTEAVLAVLLSPETGGSPTRLTVKLPATDLDGARSTLAELALQWHLDEAEIAAWAARAAAVTTASHVYSTRVFRAQPVGFVRLEFQVEHHVEQDGYVVDGLFSWDS